MKPKTEVSLFKRENELNVQRVVVGSANKTLTRFVHRGTIESTKTSADRALELLSAKVRIVENARWFTVSTTTITEKHNFPAHGTGEMYSKRLFVHCKPLQLQPPLC